MKYQLQHIVPLKTGSIVNLASIAGLNGIYMTGSYAATKHAVIGLTKSAALDYATYGITVNAIAPRPVKTSILKQAIDAGAYSEEPIADLLPVKRMGELMDIGRGIKFLLES
jgi:NAD(P)-dependent dehydrogenase (short-subunit alcohol dehydrogenase family)